MNWLLYGTDEPPVRWRTFTVGPLSFDWEDGAIRYVRLGGTEILRGIGLSLRDADWGTAPSVVDDVRFDEVDGVVEIRYRSTARLAGGSFTWDVHILADPSGIAFDAEGIAHADLTVNRVGLVVLHPLTGFVGGDIIVVHGSGGEDTIAIPRKILPDAVVLDLAAVRYAPSPGVSVVVDFRGDVFEMEDQRKFTDASFKTYSRPLAMPHPFRIAPGERVAQSVRLAVSGQARPAPRRRSVRTLPIGRPVGTMPEMAVVGEATELAGVASVAGRIDALAPQWLVLRLDAADPLLRDQLAGAIEVRRLTGVRVLLDVVIDGREPHCELAVIAAAGIVPEAIMPLPRRDLEARPTNHMLKGEASIADIIRATRTLFPNALVGGGVRSNFTELCRNPPSVTEVDFIAHATAATVHAADDRTVMESLEGLEHVIASARAMAPGAAYRLGPCTIGMLENPYGRATPNPLGRRVAAARYDPRHWALFAAAWAVGVLADAAGGGVHSLSLGGIAGDMALSEPRGALTPLGLVCREAARVACHRSLLIAPGPRDAGVAWLSENGPELLLANLTAEPHHYRVDFGGSLSLLSYSSGRWGWLPLTSRDLVLGPYAVLRGRAAGRGGP